MKRKGITAALLALVFTFFGLMTAGPANAVVVGVCTIKANDPHPSTHYTGTINSTGTVQCTMVMDEIYVQTFLEKSNGQVWSQPAVDYFNTPYEMSNAATSCKNGPGTFRTRVSYTIHAPAGVNPRYAANTIYSPWKPFGCGVATFASPAPATAVKTENFGR